MDASSLALDRSHRCDGPSRTFHPVKPKAIPKTRKNAMIPLVCSDQEGSLLVIVAAQLGWLLPRPVALGWILAQAAAMCVILGLTMSSRTRDGVKRSAGTLRMSTRSHTHSSPPSCPHSNGANGEVDRQAAFVHALTGARSEDMTERQSHHMIRGLYPLLDLQSKRLPEGGWSERQMAVEIKQKRRVSSLTGTMIQADTSDDV
jgi:hypothetical protein